MITYTCYLYFYWHARCGFICVNLKHYNMDVIIITSNNKVEISKFYGDLSFLFEMNILRELYIFLNIEVMYKRKNICISNKLYIEDY